MSIIVSNCQHCEEQQFRTLSCVHYTIFSLVKSDLVMHMFLYEGCYVHICMLRTCITRLHSCYGKKIPVRLAYILFKYRIVKAALHNCNN